MTLHNLARMTSTTTGTGTLTLVSAISGLLTFAQAGVVDQEWVPYSIRDGANSETGIGLYTASGTTIERIQVLKSTNSDLRINCSGSQEVFITPLAEALPNWNQAFAEYGDTFTNWTSGGGTWSSDGSAIQQTDTGNSWRTAKFNTVQQFAPAYVLEAQIKALSAGAGALHVVGLVVGYSGGNSSPGLSAELRLDSGTRKLNTMRAFTADLVTVSPFSWVDDTFYRMKIVVNGAFITVFVDGALVITAGASGAFAGDARFIGLTSYGCATQYQNIYGWNMAIPTYNFG